MGTGIAQVAATAGHEVVLYDNNSAAWGGREKPAESTGAAGGKESWSRRSQR